MPHIVLDLPEPKANGLDTALLKQFTAIQQQLMGFLKAQQEAAQTMRADLLTTLRRQQEELTDALESLINAVHTKPAVPDQSDHLLGAVRELRQTVAQMHRPTTPLASGTPSVTVKPNVTVHLPPTFLGRLDSLEASLLQGLRRSRSRTFGSNY